MKTYLLIAVLFLVSCRKKDEKQVVPPETEVYDTIKPKSYFPAFPCSYWKYLCNDSITTIDSVACEYQLTAWLNGKAYLPFYHGTLGYWAWSGGFIGGYNRGCLGYRPLVVNMPDYRISVFLSERKDTLDVSVPCDGRYPCPIERMAVSEKKVDENGDSVIVVKGYFYLSQAMANSPRPERTYHVYKKNVGLIFECVTSAETGDTIFKRKLLSYRIGK